MQARKEKPIVIGKDILFSHNHDLNDVVRFNNLEKTQKEVVEKVIIGLSYGFDKEYKFFKKDDEVLFFTIKRVLYNFGYKIILNREEQSMIVCN